MIASAYDLSYLRDRYAKALKSEKTRVLVCAGTGCVANGSLEIYARIKQLVEEKGLYVDLDMILEGKAEKAGTLHEPGFSDGKRSLHGAAVERHTGEGGVATAKPPAAPAADGVAAARDGVATARDGVAATGRGVATAVVTSGCHGFCEMGPLVRIEPQGILYCKVKLADAEEIVERTLVNGEVVDRLIYRHPVTGEAFAREEEIPFYRLQKRVTLANCGVINPDDVREYIARGGYQALSKVLSEMRPDQVCKEVLDSGLRGRGGGGFPTGRKWDLTRLSKGDKKYVICNGDEGDPGAFMDRSVMEGDPHRVIEGMAIAAYAVGADEGYVYVRAEYPLAVRRLKTAIAAAREAGLLGKNILGSGFSFDVKVKEGAGAFVCGEETALMASIEGQRGMPRPKPPYPADRGLWGKPTLINNVETFANVPVVINGGAAKFRSVGTPKSPGTKTFALTGQVCNTGLIEVPLGITLRQILFDIGGGIRNNKKFKAVQIGGPSGGCLTEQHLDMPLDFDSLLSVGAMVGSGGLVVTDEDTCMVEFARYFMSFTQNESCGKCVPCREGTKRMLEILERTVEGNGEPGDAKLLEELVAAVRDGSLCGLGKTAPNPIGTMLRYFRDEYEAHVHEKRCPAGVCTALKRIWIDAMVCKGCSKCSRVCPVGAISGKVKSPYAIDSEKCIKCGSCVAACPFGAVKEG